MTDERAERRTIRHVRALTVPRGLDRLRAPDVAAQLSREAAAPSWPLLVGLVVVGTVAIPLRSGMWGAGGVPWGEDGSIYLQQAYVHGGWSRLLEPYAGYVQVPARALAALATALPVSLHGLAVCFLAALVQSLLAAFAFHAVSAHCRTRFAPLVVALAVLFVPVGPEVVANLANLAWTLLAVACLTAIVLPSTRLGIATSCTIMAGAALSTPFTVVPLAFVGLVWLWGRDRRMAAVTAAGSVSIAVQAIAVVTAPSRDQPMSLTPDPVWLAIGYLRRVVADSAFGTGWYASTELAEDSSSRALIVLLAVAVLAIVGTRRTGPRLLALPAALTACSAALFVMAIIMGSPAVSEAMLVNSFTAGRYYVAPALLFLTATMVLVDAAYGSSPRREQRPYGARVVSDAATRALPLLVVGVVLLGLVVSFRVLPGLRDGSVPWSEQVREGRVECATSDTQAAVIVIAPATWGVSVPCELLPMSEGTD